MMQSGLTDAGSSDKLKHDAALHRTLDSSICQCLCCNTSHISWGTKKYIQH